MPSSNYAINKILNYNFGGTSYSSPDPMYFGLSTTLVTASSTGASVAEPSGGSYARKSFDNNTTNWGTSTLGNLRNLVALTFVESTGAWSTTIAPVVSLFIIDSASGAGNIWWYYTLTLPLVIPTSTTVTFPIGTILVSQAIVSATTKTINNILNYNFGAQAYNPDDSGTIYFGLSTETVTSTTNLSATVTAMSYTSKLVTLTADNIFAVGDPIVVSGVNAGFSVTNIDGTWVCGTGTNATTVVFTVTDQPIGTTPQTITVGTIAGVTVVEPLASSGYARVNYNNNKTTWTTSTTETLQNNVAIDFAPSSASWGVITSLFISDLATRSAGNILWYKNLSPGIIVQGGTAPISFAASSIVINMT